MSELLFKPKTIDLPPNIVLIPQFWDKVYYERLKKSSNGSFSMIQTEFVFFDNYTLVVGFLGYPHILTILEFIEGIRDKEVYFLGTAGSLNPGITQSIPLEVSEIHSTEILDHFAVEKVFPLKSFGKDDLRKAGGVTVDIIQRETAPWLRQQVERGIDFVEMEIFPLRAYLQKPFHAIVVTSDLLQETGIRVFPDKAQLAREFVRSYELIRDTIGG